MRCVRVPGAIEEVERISSESVASARSASFCQVIFSTKAAGRSRKSGEGGLGARLGFLDSHRS